jgi:hypothetical protein
MLQTIDTHFSSCLLPAQRRGLAFWVYGAVQAGSACQNAVIAALVPGSGRHVSTVRQYLREWLKDGVDKAAPCATQVAVASCFVPLLRWVLALWRGNQLALAVDVTNLADQLHLLCISIVYRSCAIPVAWHVMPGGKKGAWMPELCRMLHLLASAIPASLEVLVLTDAGLRSPALFEAATSHGWHPIQRHEQGLLFRPAGYRAFHRADSLVSRPGEAFVGSGVAFKTTKARRPATLVVVWEKDHDEPWVLLTDLDRQDAGVLWYGLRFWIECSFRIIKGMGWQWQKSRRTDPERVARHWLVMAVATCWTLASGTRVEDAEACGRLPDHVHAPPPTKQSVVHPRARARAVSIFQLGLGALRGQCSRARLWRRLWLLPEPWPEDPPDLLITRLPSGHENAA